MMMRAFVTRFFLRKMLPALCAMILCAGCGRSLPTDSTAGPDASAPPTEVPAQPPAPALEFTEHSEDGRFRVSPGGIILDTQTGCKWLVGPDQDMDYAAAEEWIESLARAGGDWRMPTREELLELHEFGKGTRHIDPVFQHSGWWIWAEPRDDLTAWFINFGSGRAFWASRLIWQNRRVFAISPHPG